MKKNQQQKIVIWIVTGCFLICSFFLTPASVHASFLGDVSNQTVSVISSVVDFFSNIFSRKPPVNMAAPVAPVERTLTPTGPTGLDSLSNREGATAPSTKVAVATTNTSTITTKYLAVSAPPKIINTFTTQYVPTGVTREELNEKLAYLQNRLQEQFLSHNSHDSSTMGGGNVSGSLVSGEEGSFAYVHSPSAEFTTLNASTITVSGDSVFTGNSTFSSPLKIAQASAPVDTTDKLYNLSEDLYWNGNLVSGAAVGTWTSSSGNVYRPTGNVGIGIINPTSRLDIVTSATSSSALTLRDANGNVSLEMRAATSTLNNVLIGLQAGASNTTGFEDTAIGAYALGSTTTGYYNTAIGSHALAASPAYKNTAVGAYALASNVSYKNTALGFMALLNNTSGFYNTAASHMALVSNTTGYQNTAYGYNALFANTTGSNNTAIGPYALQDLNITTNNGTGQNTAIGYNTGLGIVTGVNNTIIGANVTGLSAALSNNIIIADGAGNRRINVDSSGNVGIGTTSPSQALSVNGNSVVTGNITATTFTATSSISTVGLTSTANINTPTLSTPIITSDLSPYGVPSYSSLTFQGGMYPIGNEAFSFLARNDAGFLSLQKMAIYNGDTGKILLNPTGGNVGIGTTNPASALHVGGSAGLVWGGDGTTSSGLVTIGTQGASGSLFINNQGSQSNYPTGLGFDGGQSGLINTSNIKAMGNYYDGGVGYGSNLAFFTTNGTSLNEAMRIDQTGKIGIGTINPGGQLQITSTNAANVGQIIRPATSQTADLLQFTNSSGSATYAFDSSGGTYYAKAFTQSFLGFSSGALNVQGQTALNLTTHSGGNITLAPGGGGSLTMQDGGATQNYMKILASNNGMEFQSQVAGKTSTFKHYVADGVPLTAIGQSSQTASLFELKAGSSWGGSGDRNFWQALDTNGTTKLSYVDRTGGAYFAGNVGIGTTSPYAKLSVAGDIVGTNLTATGTLAVAGNSSFSGNVGITGNLAVNATGSFLGISGVNITSHIGTGGLYDIQAPSATANAIPLMTSYTTPSGVASDNGGYPGQNSWNAMDRDGGTHWSGNSGGPWILSYEFTSPQIITSYTINASGGARGPQNWTFEGYNGSTWIVLDTETGQSFVGTQTFLVSNSTSYTTYRLNITANGGDVQYTQINEWEMFPASSYSSAFAVATSGNVGIGTTTPASKLTVVGSACISAGTGATAACTTTAGHISAVSFDTASVDLAENYPTTDQSITAGDVVAVDPDHDESIVKALRQSSGQSPAVIGIVSTKPGMLLGASEKDTSLRPVALAGRVPVKFSNENGTIKRGDNLTISSSTPGVAMKWTPPSQGGAGVVIGTALSEVKADGTVMVFVRSSLASNFIQDSIATSTQQIIDSSGIIDMLKVAFLSVKEFIAEKITTKHLTIKADDLTKTGFTIYDRATGQPLCIYFENGIQKSSQGECETSSNQTSQSNTASIINSIPTAEATTTPTTTNPVSTDNSQNTATTTSSNTSTDSTNNQTSDTPNTETTTPSTGEVIITPVE